MSNTGPIGSFGGSSQGPPGQSGQPNGPPPKESVATPIVVPPDAVDFNREGQLQLAAARAAGRGFLFELAQEQLQMQSVTAGQEAEVRLTRRELDQKTLLEKAMEMEETHDYTKKLARKDARAEYRTEAYQGLRDGEKVPKGDEASSAGGGGSSGGGNG